MGRVDGEIAVVAAVLFLLIGGVVLILHDVHQSPPVTRGTSCDQALRTNQPWTYCPWCGDTILEGSERKEKRSGKRNPDRPG